MKNLLIVPVLLLTACDMEPSAKEIYENATECFRNQECFEPNYIPDCNGRTGRGFICKTFEMEPGIDKVFLSQMPTPELLELGYRCNLPNSSIKECREEQERFANEENTLIQFIWAFDKETMKYIKLNRVEYWVVVDTKVPYTTRNGEHKLKSVMRLLLTEERENKITNKEIQSSKKWW
ncbi:MAG: hypothetical protein NC311_04270 [Muribaculaceae bacterium]|nr:hypothetical protein [Muribaculaceae bacterium]